MNWDYEIISEQTVLDLSYRTVKEILEKDIQKNGFRNAMIKASRNFDVAVNHLRECNASNYLDKCDEAYRIILSTYSAMAHITLKYVHNINTNWIFMSGPFTISNDNYTVAKSLQLMINDINVTTAILMESLEMIRNGKSRASISGMIKREKKTENWAALSATWTLVDNFDKPMINQEMAICRFLDNFNGRKSMGELFVERMNKIIHTYCQYSNKNELRVHKKMYNEVTNFMSGVGETSPVIRGLGKLLFNSEQRYNAPFAYNERKGW